MPVQNAEIAEMFDQTAEPLEIKGENQFRVRAYRRAARTIEGLPQSVRSLLATGADLSELPGIGKDLAGKIADIAQTGHFALLDSLKKKLPGQLGEIAALPGLGPKRVKTLYDQLKVRTLDDLRRTVQSGRLHKLRGFGPAIERKLHDALEKPQVEKRFKLSVAEAEALVGYPHDAGRVVVAGSYRRRRDTVGDLDVPGGRRRRRGGRQQARRVRERLRGSCPWPVACSPASGALPERPRKRSMASSDCRSSPGEIREDRGEIALAQAHRLRTW